MARSFVTSRYGNKMRFIQTPRVKAVQAELAWMARYGPSHFGAPTRIQRWPEEQARIMRQFDSVRHRMFPTQSRQQPSRFQYGLNRAKYRKAQTRYPRRPKMRIKLKPVYRRRL